MSYPYGHNPSSKSHSRGANQHHTNHQNWDARVSDTEWHHYQLVVSGWQQGKRVHGIVVQINIRDGSIWIQEDGTDINLANELVQLGIPEDKTVLVYHVSNLPNTNDLTTKSVR